MKPSNLPKYSLQVQRVPTRENLDTTYAQVVSLRKKIVEVQAALKHKNLDHSLEKDLRT